MNSQSHRNKQLSFEFFPTQTSAGAEHLKQAALQLAELNPDFFSVTYGAGGSTRDRTLGAVLATQSTTHVSTAPHLACIGDTKEHIKELLTDYKQQGIKRIVALRGDLPADSNHVTGDFHYANELVEFIRKETLSYFNIAVAAYPEMHPQAPCFETDIHNFRRKVEVGASSAITQYFFNADSYFYFIERTRRLGITIPVTPGIMPIANFEKLARFSDACGAEIPRWIRKQLEAYGDDSLSIRQFGEEMVTRMCERLLEGGAPGLHFYTLNRADGCQRICTELAGHFSPAYKTEVA